jgi:hypothetical protein
MNKIINIIVFIFVTIFFTGCFQKDLEIPKQQQIPEGTLITLENVVQFYYDSVATKNNTPYKFKEDFSVLAVVTMDDKSGNLYKSAYIQDANVGINIRLQSPGGLYQGDSIRLNLKNTILSMYHNMLQIDSVHVDKNITKLSTNHNIAPQLVSIGTITDGIVGKLVKLENVEFVANEIGMIYAEPNLTVNRTLEDCSGATIIVRNSGYANFASKIIPSGRGSVVGVIGKYNNDIQLFIRSIEEVQLTKNRCGEVDAFFTEKFDNFNNDEIINISGWLNISNSSTRKWLGAVINNGKEHTASIKNNNITDTTWLVLPRQTIENNVAMKFNTIVLNATGSKLELVYSTDFNGTSDPKTATWTTLPATFATGQTFTESGEINLPEGQMYIAFRYSGIASSTTTFYLDNIYIYNKE